ncbi:UPF0161 protein [Acorus calamus]|uniref:UPF0161 protein n=1 Tax=Acorus calamus TaxID=4465 RepID=A0AAV9DEA7_ACOCL|nr:UPF0161 protein [Acorus calamus]
MASAAVTALSPATGPAKPPSNRSTGTCHVRPKPQVLVFPPKKQNLKPTRASAVNGGSDGDPTEDEEVKDLGVKTALSMLRFYKREISPILPKSCRYVPTCSEYSMIAYKKYGVVKGTVLTAWRLCRCNPLGGSGFDPPRWFDESPPEK